MHRYGGVVPWYEDRSFTVLYANSKLDGYLKRITRDVIFPYSGTDVQNFISGRDESLAVYEAARQWSEEWQFYSLQDLGCKMVHQYEV